MQQQQVQQSYQQEAQQVVTQYDPELQNNLKQVE